MPLAIAADLAALSLAFEAARGLRLSLGGWLFVPMSAETLQQLAPPLWMVLGGWLASAWWFRLYRPRWAPSRFVTLVQVVESMAVATAVTIVLSVAIYADQGGLSRAFLLLLFACGVVFALLLRSGVWLAGRVAGAHGRPVSLLVVGGGQDTPETLGHLSHAAGGQVVVRGLVTGIGGPAREVPVPVLGTTQDLRRAINQTRASRVLVVDTDLPMEVLAECIDVCASMHVPLNCTGGGLTRFSTVVGMGEVAGLRMLEVRRPEFERTQDVMKRATDLAVAGAAILLALPVCGLLAAAIKLSSPGPVLYVSDRVGRGGRLFSCLKFRSMVDDAEALRLSAEPGRTLDGHLFKAPNDSRVTTVGRLMRRLSLDELPQLWNVLRGDMSLVGPRPLPASDLDPDGLSARFRTWSVARSTIRPGLTGLWQVRGRSELRFEDMVRLDVLYVRTRSFHLDLQILVETIPAVILGRGAM